VKGPAEETLGDAVVDEYVGEGSSALCPGDLSRRLELEESQCEAKIHWCTHAAAANVQAVKLELPFPEQSERFWRCPLRIVAVGSAFERGRWGKAPPR
jgi:hypothetical protein